MSVPKRQGSAAGRSCRALAGSRLCVQADICQLGMDQRKVNMLAREYCDAIKRKLKPVILSHAMLPGLKQVSNLAVMPWCCQRRARLLLLIWCRLSRAGAKPAAACTGPVAQGCWHAAGGLHAAAGLAHQPCQRHMQPAALSCVPAALQVSAQACVRRARRRCRRACPIQPSSWRMTRPL